ncbi:MAG: DUF547 domain-containing protein [Elusimicrobia bacterium]|nr:DUF547 domain-containing protein [Elusimicrobiota bacterium]
MARAALACCALLAGCGLRLSPPRMDNARAVQSPIESWSNLLSQRLDAQGRVDFDGLRKEPADLHNFLSYVATFSPESDPDRFPSAASRMAYYLNAYNAMALYVVIDSEIRPADRKAFYARSKLMVGGSLLSLSDLEDALAELKDSRLWFAASGAARGYPRLAATPYAAAKIEEQLDQAARAFLNDPAHVHLDKARKRARVSELLKWRRAVFQDRSASLLAYVNRFRDDKLPENYKVEFLPFDWELREQKPDPQAKNPAN